MYKPDNKIALHHDGRLIAFLLWPNVYFDADLAGEEIDSYIRPFCAEYDIDPLGHAIYRDQSLIENFVDAFKELDSQAVTTVRT